MGTTLYLFFLLILILIFCSIFLSYYLLYKNKNLDFFLKILVGFLYTFFVSISLLFVSNIKNEIYYLYHDKTQTIQSILFKRDNANFELIFENIETNSENKVIRMRYKEKDSDKFIINILLGNIYRVIFTNDRLVWIQSRTGFYCIELQLGIILINESNGSNFIRIDNTKLWIYEWQPKENINSSGLKFKVYDISKPAILATNIHLLNQYPMINEPVKEYKINYQNNYKDTEMIFKEIESLDIETKTGKSFHLEFKAIEL